MSYTKQMFNTSTASTHKTQLKAWLEANATDWFDSIEVDENNLYAKKEGFTVFKVVYSNYGNSQYGRFAVGSKYTTVSFMEKWGCDYVVKTSKGLCFHFAKDSSDSRSYQGWVFITKTEDNSMGILAIGAQEYSSSYYHRMYVIDFDNTQTASYMRSETKDILEMLTMSAGQTALINFPLYQDAKHLADVYIIPVSQYKGVGGEISYNGDTFWTNGYLAMGE